MENGNLKEKLISRGISERGRGSAFSVAIFSENRFGMELSVKMKRKIARR